MCNLSNKIDELKYLDTENIDESSEYNIEKLKVFNKLHVATWLNSVKMKQNDLYIKHLSLKINTSDFVINIPVTYRLPDRSEAQDIEIYSAIRQTLIQQVANYEEF